MPDLVLGRNCHRSRAIILFYCLSAVHNVYMILLQNAYRSLIARISSYCCVFDLEVIV